VNNSEMMHFRATPELADALAKAAEREGVSQSEIIRRAVSGRLGCDPKPAAEIDPFERVYAVARGDLQAMRDMVNFAVRAAFSGDENIDPSQCLRDGLTYARLAATFGDPADQGAFLSIVALLGQIEGDEAVAEEFAEAIARISHAADNGNDYAADNLHHLVEMADAATIEEAQDMRKRLRDDFKRETV
jgi:hypothetical protein